MDFKFITYEKRGRVGHITINRPERLNAVHPPASGELRRAFEDFRDDPALLVAILTGAGDRAFSAGNDLRYTAEHGRLTRESHKVPFGGITADFTCWKPIIAAVNGYALGGGLELAIACDIIVAAEHAEMGAPEPLVGLLGLAGGVHRMVRQVPLKTAMGILLSSKRMTAQEAYRLGLVNEVVPLVELMPTAERWASDIMAGAPLSIRATKQMATEGLGRPLEEAMNGHYSEFEKALESDDWVEGPKAFAEKRPPKWTGA